MTLELPKVSVVTVVRNAETTIESTIVSVLSQSYPNLEYIVIDGKSDDRTNFIIEGYREQIDTYLSEPDQGIFDAMNKGAKLASGDWIIYMNAGDYFYTPDSLMQLKDALKSDADVILAGAEKILEDELETRHFRTMPGEVAEIWRQMPIVHQATLVRLSCQQQYQFNTRYTWCADHDLLARMYRDGKKFLRQEHLICYYDCSGGKVRDPKLFIWERWRLSRGLVPWYRHLLQYGSELFHCTVWGKVVSIVKMFLPASTILRLRRWRGTAGN